MGYYTNYKRDIANGMSEAEALEKFNNYNKTQQTRRAIDKSKIQLTTRNPQNVGAYILKALTQFRSVQFLYINQFVQVVDKIVKDIKAGGVKNVKPKYDSGQRSSPPPAHPEVAGAACRVVDVVDS